MFKNLVIVKFVNKTNSEHDYKTKFVHGPFPSKYSKHDSILARIISYLKTLFICTESFWKFTTLGLGTCKCTEF